MAESSTGATAPSPDPLDVLQAAIAVSLPISLLTAAYEPTDSLKLASYISFPPAAAPGASEPVRLLKDAATRYTARADATSEFYTLAQVYLAWAERETGVVEYLKKATEAGTGNVGIADRRAVVDVLLGAEGAEDRAGARLRGKGEAAAVRTDTTQGAEAGPSKPVAVKRKYEVNEADRDFCRKLRAEEIELRDRNSVLRSTNGGKINNFAPFVQNVMSEKIKALRNALSGPASKTAQTSSQPAYEQPRGAKKAKSSNPIIIISNSPSALITMWNVKKLLEQGIFEPSDVARQNEASAGNFRAEDMIPVVRTRTSPQGEITQKYYVVDGVEALQKFGQDAWDRVLCVVTTGQAWQFKNYKWQEPRQLFKNVQGVYFQWSNEPNNPIVKDWNVKELRFDRNRRHTDRQVVADLWRTLDAAKRR